MKRWMYLIGVILSLLLACNVWAQEEDRITVYSLLERCGILVNESTEWEYFSLEEDSEYLTILNESASKNALFVKTENNDGQVTETILIGLEEAETMYLPVDFEINNSFARNASWEWAPSELNQAPIILVAQTYYTRGGTSEEINPSGFAITYYNQMVGNESASLVHTTGTYVVTGPPLYNGVATTYVPGYEYYPLTDFVEYRLERTFYSMQAGVAYTATKVFPAGYTIKTNGGISGNSIMSVSGQVLTSSGITRTFNVSFSGMPLNIST